MGLRYQCKLSDELLKKAVAELNEPIDDQLRLIEIEKLRTSFANTVPEIASKHNYDDAFFLRFLRTSKFNQERALTMITNYHVQRQNWNEMFDKVNNPSLIAAELDSGGVLPLEGKAKDGSTVLVARPGINGTSSMINMYALGIMVMEKLVEDEDVQINGITVIDDLSYVSTAHAKQMTPFFAKKISKVIQDSMPLRFKSLNFTNEPRIFDIIFAIIQPFMKEKIRKRIKAHGTDFSKLHNVVDKTVLPPMFSGSGPDLDPDCWKHKLYGENSS